LHYACLPKAHETDKNEIVNQTLERVRLKLIDLSRRNNLINFRETRRTIKIIDEQTDKIFRLLISNNGPLELLPFEPEEDEEKEKETTYQSNLPFIESDKSSPDKPKKVKKHKDNTIQTTLLAQPLERRAKILLRHWRTGIEEAGINYLYLAIGFLEWCEHDNSEIKSSAPLILIPLIIERARLNKQTKCYSYVIRYSGEDIETNLSLSEKLGHDFNLVLPDITEDSRPEEYIKKVGQSIKKMKNWGVKSDVMIGFFSFAKLRLYRDLNNAVWPYNNRLTDHPIVKDILVGRESEKDTETFGYADDYEIDKFRFGGNTPLILDTDSSQHSAIIDVLHNKKNMVIEGPPGTGKSQTITNLIGAALYQDMSILFVSEKKAALEVVRNRLDALGLGDFCLELHSHKTQKGQLHKDLAQRINRQYQDIAKLDHEIEDFKYERDRLQKYYDLLNQYPAKNGKSIYEIFWAAERWKEEAKEYFINLKIENALKLGRIQIKKSIEALEDFVAILSELPNDVRLTWTGYEPNIIMPGEDVELKELFKEISDDTIQFINIFRENEAQCDPRFINDNIHRLRSLGKLNYTILNKKPATFDREIAITFLSKEPEQALLNLIKQIEQKSKLSNKYDYLRKTGYQWSKEELNNLKLKAQKVKTIGLGNLTISKLKKLTIPSADLLEFIEELRKETDNVKWLFSEPPFLLSDYDKINVAMKQMESAPPDIILHPHPSHAMKICNTIYEQARQEFLNFTNELTKQSDLFKIEKLPTHQEIVELAEKLFSVKNFIKKIFSSNYRKAKKSIRDFLVSPKSLKKEDFGERLLEVVSIQKNIQKFNEDEDNKQILGELYKGMTTDWDRLKKIIEWSQRLTRSLESEQKTKTILSDFSKYKEKLQTSENKISGLIQSIKDKAKEIGIGVKQNTKTQSLKTFTLQIKKTITDFLQEITDDHQTDDLKINLIINSASAGLELEKLELTVKNDQRYPAYFGKWYKGFQTDTETLESNFKWIAQLISKGGFYKDLVQWLLTDEYETKISVITKIGKASNKYFIKFDSFINHLSQSGSFNFDTWFKHSKQELKLPQVKTKLDDCFEKSGYIIAWSGYLSLRNNANNLGLSRITKEIESSSLNKKDATNLFRGLLYQSMANEVIRLYPDLASFQRASFDNIRERIKVLDKSILSKSRKRIAYKVSKRPVPRGVGKGYVKDLTELSLINHELGKKKSHIPIRQLVRRSGRALQALKPCFMMSPQSVAQYLVPGETQFDLLLMDEASQLKLEDAIGTIARSNQVAVVGDPKQLPPTTFFERIIEADPDFGETTAAEEAESILDVCQNCFDKRRLRWHYRSEHEQLIAFSNHEFYDNDLIVFPSPHPKDESYGVHYKYVENGYYTKRRNRTEAQQVAMAVIEHVQRHPELSLGVATFNLEQRDLIHDILEHLQKENPWLEKAFKKNENPEHPFFIKNLENVQGDERDVIIISTTYGPDQNAGKVYQRFGPINSPVGWRRLNVIVTRAKRRLIIFTSMHSSDIRITPGASQGVIALKKYLEFAETGRIIDLGHQTGKDPDSDFEIAVAKQLNNYGYKTSYQIGVVGFFIDIGVHHPFSEEEFILGIECDGAAYHSAKSIRDRDILRQRILESKGWRIYRIWSTDWFKNKEKELQNLLGYLEKLTEAERIKVERIKKKATPVPEDVKLVKDEPSDLDNELKKELIAFRKKYLDPICEDIKCNILSDKMIDEFIRIKPITKNEFHKIPQAYRENIATGQAKYLDEIFEIVEEYAV